MKRCPTCNRIYTDDTLIYCLTDGSSLSAPSAPVGTEHLPAFHPFPMQISAKGFRILIIVYWLLTFVSLVLQFTTQHLLPPALQEYLKADLYAPTTMADLFTSVLIIPLLLFTLVVWVGLIFFKRWARKLLPFSIAADILAVAFLGPTVELGLITSLFYLSVLIEGMVLTLAFFSPINERFKA
jgi:hypothetical protein